MNDRNEHGHGLAAPLPAVGVAEFAEGLRSGRFTAEATTRALLERIAKENMQLDAFTAVDDGGALAAARAADQ